MHLNRALKKKLPLYEPRQNDLQYDNARSHISQPVYLETLKWEVLSHPPYSPNIAPSDYYLFRSMAHDLAEQHFHSYEDAKKWVDSWVASKDVSFFRREIQVLPERWEKIMASWTILSVICFYDFLKIKH